MWKQIPGTDGHYEASDAGEIRSIDRVIVKMNRWGKVSPQRFCGCILKPWCDANGYATVYICIGRKKRAVNVHRLVASAFHGQREGMDVNHIDGNKQNNAPGNLEWCSRSENMRHAQRIGLVPQARPVIAIPLDGGQPQVFSSSRAAAVALGNAKKRGNIASAICGLIPSAYGFRWGYA